MVEQSRMEELCRGYVTQKASRVLAVEAFAVFVCIVQQSGTANKEHPHFGHDPFP